MMKPLNFVALAASSLFAISCLSAAAQSTIPVKITAESQSTARKIYGRDCSICHNDNGDGKTDIAKGMGLTLPDYSDPKVLANVSDQELFSAIRSGKGDKMPPEDAGRANDAEVWNLVVYVRKLGVGAATAAAAPAK